MLKRFSVVLLVIFALFAVCSCNNEPSIPKDKENLAAVGVKAAMDIIEEYTGEGSYPGVSVIAGDNYTVAFKYDDASITESFAEIDSSFGTHTVKVNGEVVMAYEAYPSSYPCSVSVNISFVFGGSNHTLEFKAKYTGVSSFKASLLKLDGKSYDPSTIK